MCMTWPTGRIRSLWIKSASKKARHWRGRPFQCSVLDMKGQSDLFAVGHYEDRLVKNGDTWLIDSRTVRLHTRMFTVPTLCRFNEITDEYATDQAMCQDRHSGG